MSLCDDDGKWTSVLGVGAGRERDRDLGTVGVGGPGAVAGCRHAR
jgi:hypothetical protein